MATVYLARDLRHDRNVALKVLSPSSARLGVERFLPRSRSRPTCSTRTCCRCSTRGEADGLLFYVMPFVEGETLRARLEREKQLPVDEAVRIAVGSRQRAATTRTPRRHPPRPQAGEHPAAGRAAGGGGLRHRAGRQQGGRNAGHADRPVVRYAAVHEPRAGDRRSGRSTAGPTSIRWAR